MKKFKAAHKIIELVFILSGFIILIGFAANLCIDKIIGNLDSTYVEKIQNLTFLLEIPRHTRANDANILRLFIIQDTSNKEQILSNFKSRSNRINELLNKISRNKLDDTERSIINKFKNDYNNYLSLQNDVIKLTLQNDSELKTAYKKYTKSARILEQLNFKIRYLAEYYNYKLVEENQRMKIYSSNLKNMIMICIILTSALTILMGVLVSKRVDKSFTDLELKMNNTEKAISSSLESKKKLIERLKDAIDDQDK